jgi:hypothetical protein
VKADEHRVAAVATGFAAEHLSVRRAGDTGALRYQGAGPQHQEAGAPLFQDARMSQYQAHLRSLSAANPAAFHPPPPAELPSYLAEHHASEAALRLHSSLRSEAELPPDERRAPEPTPAGAALRSAAPLDRSAAADATHRAGIGASRDQTSSVYGALHSLPREPSSALRNAEPSQVGHGGGGASLEHAAYASLAAGMGHAERAAARFGCRSGGTPAEQADGDAASDRAVGRGQGTSGDLSCAMPMAHGAFQDTGYAELGATRLEESGYGRRCASDSVYQPALAASRANSVASSVRSNSSGLPPPASLTDGRSGVDSLAAMGATHDRTHAGQHEVWRWVDLMPRVRWVD